MLYLFAGTRRRGDVAGCTLREARQRGLEVVIDEVDIARSPHDDLTQVQLQDDYLEQLRAGRWRGIKRGNAACAPRMRDQSDSLPRPQTIQKQVVVG